MVSLFKQYKPFFFFLGRFLFVYLFLLFSYKIYLSGFDLKALQTDGMTTMVANQANGLMHFLGYESHIKPSLTEACINFYYGPNDYYVRIVEGCNAVSVMILFAAFCFAFSAYFWRTFIFVTIGFLLIHLLNIVRIVLILILIVKYPHLLEVLHDIVFPLFIYGVVFLLWCLWLFKLSGYAKKYYNK